MWRTSPDKYCGGPSLIIITNVADLFWPSMWWTPSDQHCEEPSMLINMGDISKSPMTFPPCGIFVDHQCGRHPLVIILENCYWSSIEKTSGSSPRKKSLDHHYGRHYPTIYGGDLSWSPKWSSSHDPPSCCYSHAIIPAIQGFHFLYKLDLTLLA